MTQQPAQTICRSCGFAAHKPEDLINGQCPRWVPPAEAIALGREAQARMSAAVSDDDYSDAASDLSTAFDALSAHLEKSL